nr:DoxX family membrane protein [Methylophilus sp. 5]
MPAEVSCNLVMTFELVVAVALLLGLFTRFFRLSLLRMLSPLVTKGAGKWGFDRLLSHLCDGRR